MRLSYLYDMFLYIQSAQTVSHSCKTSFTRAWIAHLCTTFQLWEGKQLDPPLQLYFNICLILACMNKNYWIKINSDEVTFLYIFCGVFMFNKRQSGHVYYWSICYSLPEICWTTCSDRQYLVRHANFFT